MLKHHGNKKHGRKEKSESQKAKMIPTDEEVKILEGSMR